jgi:hypothetical protein
MDASLYSLIILINISSIKVILGLNLGFLNRSRRYQLEIKDSNGNPINAYTACARDIPSKSYTLEPA